MNILIEYFCRDFNLYRGRFCATLIFMIFFTKVHSQTVAKDNPPPNILLIVFDDASFDHFSANGSKWVKTPGFDRVANEGILFENFYTPNAKCAPSRSIILTGLYPWQLKEGANHIGFFPQDIRVITEALQQNGYSTAYTGKPWGPGIALTTDGKTRPLNGKPYLQKTTIPPTQDISRNDYKANFADFLDEKKKDEPWFFWCGAWEPHRPYQFDSGRKIAGKNVNEIDRVPSYLPNSVDVKADLLDYALEIEYFDQQIVQMLNDLERRKLLDNTLVIITSDNGMPFPRAKGNSYEISNHIPMAMMWPNGISKKGVNVSDYFSTVDLVPTILDVSKTNHQTSGMLKPAGKSLIPVFCNPKIGNSKDKGVLFFGRERNDFGRPNNEGYPSRSIMKDGFLYIYNFKNDRYPSGNPLTGYLDTDGSPSKTAILNQRKQQADSILWKLSFGLRPTEELYNIKTDKDCLYNLAGSKKLQKVKANLKEKLFTKLTEQQDPRVLGKGDVFDNYPFMSPDFENFYERVKSKEITEPWKKTPWVNPTDFE